MSNNAKIVEWHDISFGFLYYPRDTYGNLMTDPKTGKYPVANLISANKKGAVSHKNNTLLDGNLTYWVGVNKVIAAGYYNGKRIVPSSRYSFIVGKYYLTVEEHSAYGSSGYVSIKVYTIAKKLKQEIILPDLLRIRIIQANKYANELLIIGGTQDQYTVTKEVPFPYDPLDFTTSQGIEYHNLMKRKWEKIVKYSVLETGDPLAPIAIVEVYAREHWNGVMLQKNLVGTKTVVGSVIGPDYRVYEDTVMEGSYTTTAITLDQVVMQAGYAQGTTYKEVVFTNESYIGTGTSYLRAHFRINASNSGDGTPGVGVRHGTFHESISSADTWSYNVGGNACQCQSTSNFDLNSSNGGILTNEYLVDISSYKLDLYNPYSKLESKLKSYGSDSYSYTGNIPGVYILPWSGAIWTWNNMSGPAKYLSNEMTEAGNKIMYPPKDNGAVPLEVDLFRSLGVSGSTYDSGNGRVYIYLDVSESFVHRCSKVVTDKYGNHLVMWATDSTVAMNNSSVTGKIWASDLSKYVTLGSVIQNTYYANDVYGVV